MRVLKYRTSLVVAAVVLAAAGCSGDGSNAPATTGEASPVTEPTTQAETTTQEETTTAETGPSPDVVAWAKRWRRRVYAPVRKAGVTFVANANAAVEGNSSASFRVSGQLDKLSNCRNPVEFELSPAPAELGAARRLSLQACRSAFVGVDTFINGWNQTNMQGYASDATRGQVRKGIGLVKKALRLLRRAERAVAKATEA